MLANALGNLAKLYLQQDAREEALRCFDEAILLASLFPLNTWAKSQVAEYTEKVAELGQMAPRGESR